MKIVKVFTLSIMVLGVVGCASPVPVAENFPLSYQKVARTAKHWDIVAADVVAQTASVLASTEALKGRAVFVPSTARNTAFDATFNDFLINHMVGSGMQVSVCPASSGTGLIVNPDVKVRYDTRVIGHAERHLYRPGLLTALAAGIVVARSSALSDLSSGETNNLIFGSGVLADIALGHMAQGTRTEIVVTTTIDENNRFIMRRSDIYYVPDGDVNLFVQRIARSSTCPGQQGIAGTKSQMEDSVEAEQSRQEMFIKAMRRTNPAWRPESVSYSY